MTRRARASRVAKRSGRSRNVWSLHAWRGDNRARALDGEREETLRTYLAQMSELILDRGRDPL
jgi:hypothetical protein